MNQIINRLHTQWTRLLRQGLAFSASGREPPMDWEATLDAIEDWICIIDPGAKIIQSNKNAPNLFKPPDSEIKGTLCCRLLHNRNTPLPGCPLERMMLSGKRESQEMEFGDGQWMLVTVDPIFNPSGSIQGAVHIARDITRRIMIQNEREILVRDLKSALGQIKTLRGLLPICASCKKIRDDKGYWNLIESYIESHSQASFSHSLCPDCMESLYGKESWYRHMKDQASD